MVLMKEFKYSFAHIKKNFNAKNFIEGLPKVAKNANERLIDDIIWYTAFGKLDSGTLNSPEWHQYSGKLVDDFNKKKNKKFRLKVHNYEFDGTLLPRISENFKLEIFYEFNVSSHALISSKFKKKYFYIYCLRTYDKKNIFKAVNIIQFHHIEKIFKKKINKVEFFKYIIDRDKKLGLFMSGGDWTYMSSKGVDYYDLYKKGKLRK